MSGQVTTAANLRAERVALAAGLMLATVALSALAALAATQPGIAKGLGLQWLAHTAIGKETSIPTGLAAGVPPVMVALASFAQDAVVLLVGYPVAQMAGRGALRWPWLARIVRRPRPRRDKFADRTETVGVTLLAASLWLPFLPSGGLVAALVGRAAGYRPQLFIPIIALSALMASVAYTSVYVYAFERLEDPRIVWGAAVAMAIVSLVIGWVYHRRERARSA